MKPPRIIAPTAITSAALALALTTGCTRPSEPTDATANGAAPIAATPSTDPRADMLGRWTIDPERLAEQPTLAGKTPEQKQLALEMSRNLLASMTVRFEGDRYAITIGGKTVEGAYTIVGQQGADLTVELVEDDGEAPERVTLRVDSRGVVMTSGGDVLPLRRRTERTADDPPPSGEGPATGR